VNAEFAVAVARIETHLFAEPGRTREILLGVLEFEFRHHQARIAAAEDIDLEAGALFPEDIPGLLDHPIAAECEERLAIASRNRVFEFLTSDAPGRTLHRQPRRSRG